jgi:hypothetical protein
VRSSLLSLRSSAVLSSWVASSSKNRSHTMQPANKALQRSVQQRRFAPLLPAR